MRVDFWNGKTLRYRVSTGNERELLFSFYSLSLSLRTGAREYRYRVSIAIVRHVLGRSKTTDFFRKTGKCADSSITSRAWPFLKSRTDPRNVPIFPGTVFTSQRSRARRRVRWSELRSFCHLAVQSTQRVGPLHASLERRAPVRNLTVQRRRFGRLGICLTESERGVVRGHVHWTYWSRDDGPRKYQGDRLCAI